MNRHPVELQIEKADIAILAEDFDGMEELGIYEIIEEDLALCEFIDVSKHDIQSIVRDGLDLMQYS